MQADVFGTKPKSKNEKKKKKKKKIPHHTKKRASLKKKETAYTHQKQLSNNSFFGPTIVDFSLPLEPLGEMEEDNISIQSLPSFTSFASPPVFVDAEPNPVIPGVLDAETMSEFVKEVGFYVTTELDWPDGFTIFTRIMSYLSAPTKYMPGHYKVIVPKLESRNTSRNTHFTRPINEYVLYEEFHITRVISVASDDIICGMLDSGEWVTIYDNSEAMANVKKVAHVALNLDMLQGFWFDGREELEVSGNFVKFFTDGERHMINEYYDHFELMGYTLYKNSNEFVWSCGRAGHKEHTVWSQLENEFYIGQEVQVRDQADNYWTMGTVSSLWPLLVEGNGYGESLEWDYVIASGDNLNGPGSDNNVVIGDYAELPDLSCGIVMFIGKVHFGEGMHCGIELDDQFEGFCDGSVNNIFYFKTAQKRAVFVLKKHVKVIDMPASEIEKRQIKRQPVPAKALKYKVGKYLITKPAIGRDGPRIRCDSTVVKNYSTDDVVNIVEIQYVDTEHRLRGKIDDGNWITLYDPGQDVEFVDMLDEGDEHFYKRSPSPKKQNQTEKRHAGSVEMEYKEKPKTKRKRDHIGLLFNRIDFDNSGEVTLDELTEALLGVEKQAIERLLGQEVNAKTIRNLDKDKNQSISLDEFRAFIDTNVRANQDHSLWEFGYAETSKALSLDDLQGEFFDGTEYLTVEQNIVTFGGDDGETYKIEEFIDCFELMGYLLPKKMSDEIIWTHEINFEETIEWNRVTRSIQETTHSRKLSEECFDYEAKHGKLRSRDKRERKILPNKLYTFLLEEEGFYKKDVVTDGDCLFESIATHYCSNVEDTIPILRSITADRLLDRANSVDLNEFGFTKSTNNRVRKAETIEILELAKALEINIWVWYIKEKHLIVYSMTNGSDYSLPIYDVLWHNLNDPFSKDQRNHYVPLFKKEEDGKENLDKRVPGSGSLSSSVCHAIPIFSGRGASMTLGSGLYRILIMTVAYDNVRKNNSGGSGKLKKRRKYEAGEMVNIVNVKYIEEENIIRGKVHPMEDWITLFNTKTKIAHALKIQSITTKITSRKFKE